LGRYKFFNTNTLWVDLQALRVQLGKYNGTPPLPVLKSGKSVDPRDKTSTEVLQLRTATGAAISSRPPAFVGDASVDELRRT